MSTITLPNIRVGSDLQVRVRLKDGGVAIDWSTLQNIKACIYSDAQRALAGRCAFSIDEEDSTLLVCTYAANKPQYLGVNRIVISAKYMGETKTYDKPAFSFVRWTADQEGEEITINDPDVDVEIDVEDVSSSILQEAVDAAFSAADRANEAAAAAEHMVDIHTGPEGKSAYEVAVEEGYTGTEDEWLASLKGPVGETPDISIGTVTTVEPGTPAAASMTGTPEAPVLNLSIPKGLVGATPNFTVGTVTTGEPGSSVIVTITGTPEAPVLNLTIPQGMQGNTGSSVDYPYELVNNLTTNDATKGLSAAQGVVLDGKVSQLEAKVDGNYDYVEQDVEYFPGYIKNTDPVIPDYNSFAGTYSAIFNVEEGDKFKLYGTGGSSLLPMYIITDVAFSVLDLFYDSNTHRNPPKEVTIPVNGRYLFVNLYNFVTGDKVEKYVKIEGLADKLDTVSANIERIDGVLKGTKKFADLITTISANTYYPTTNEVINPDSPGSLTGSSTTKVECKGGDVFRIFGYGKTGATKQYAFVDSLKNNILTPEIAILSRSDGNVVTAPTNAAYLLINFVSYDSTTDKVQSLVVDDEGFIESVNDRFNGAYGVGENKDGFLLNHYFNTASNQPVFRGTADYYEGVSCQCVPCKPGDEFKIFGKGNAGVIQLYAFVDKNNNWLYRPVTVIDAKANGLVVTAPSDSAFLVVNYLDYDATTDKLLSTINTVQSVSDTAKKSLIGKKIVLFGDSISQNKYNGKGWSDYASEITGAEFINCAIGGTQIKSRVPLITLFDSTIQYEVGERVYYKPDSSMRCYVFNNSHLGAWDSNDCEEVTDSKMWATLDMCNLVAVSCDTVTPIEHRFDNVLAAAECCHDILGANGLMPIISRLISIDWTTIDAVILMGGVNDYGTGHLGASGGTDRTTTLGAINDIVANLCGTYRAIPFYYVSPVVQWTGFPNTQTPATWCDVYVKSYETITLKQYAEAILNEVKKNHIPGFDIYNLLGWNMNNFSEFYTNDGTHPLRGFKQIAYKIAGFLQTNKAF